MGDKINQKKEEKSSKGRDFFRFLGVASTVGINMVACTFIGFAIGYWLIDANLGTFPWFTIFFLILGIIAGFRYLFRIAHRADEKTEGDK